MANTNLRIKEIAKQKRMTLESVAEKLGIARTSLAQAMSRNNFSMDKLSKIADILGIEIHELFASSKNETIVCPHCGEVIDIEIKIKANN